MFSLPLHDRRQSNVGNKRSFEDESCKKSTVLFDKNSIIYILFLSIQALKVSDLSINDIQDQGTRYLSYALMSNEVVSFRK